MERHPALTRRALGATAVSAAFWMLAAGRARAQSSAGPRAAVETVDLNLVLAIDVSGSVNQRRYELQRSGYAAAFRHPRVIKSIQAGVHGAIAVTLVQWTGPSMQENVLPWTVIRDERSANDFARSIDGMGRRLYSGGTSISGAIDYSAALLARAPYTAQRHVIDVSGDGATNRGRSTAQARDEAVAMGITINGLPILELERNLDEFYRTSVIGGPNSFMVVAETFDEFADAVLKKLVIEIASSNPPGAGDRLAAAEIGPARSLCIPARRRLALPGTSARARPGVRRATAACG